MCPLNIASISSVRTPTERQEITWKRTFLSNRTNSDCHFSSSHHYCLTYYTFFLSNKSWEIEGGNVFCIKKPFRWVPCIFIKEREKSFCCWAVLEEQIEGLELSSKAAAPAAVWQWRAAGGDKHSNNPSTQHISLDTEKSKLHKNPQTNNKSSQPAAFTFLIKS